ncbi:hypothetical protein B0H34DRAFT_849014 [Crassisporium funariophilum]|nr:hypothetical protein B0H34DRAFT_849014 [Crassisporium funariophilum]
MSEFVKLKQVRKARETASYVPTSVPQPHVPNFGDAASTSQKADTSIEARPLTEDTVPTPTNGPVPLDVDGLYLSLPSVLDVRAHEGSGRGIYSKTHRNPGDVLISVKPHVAALSNDHLEEYCSNCFGLGVNALRRCTGCKLLFYCDSKCQNADWVFHRYECVALQRWGSSTSETSGSPTIPGDAIRCLGRILWRKQKLGRDSVWSREIDGLQSHRTSLTKDPNAQDSQMHTHLAHAIVRFLGLTSPQDLSEYGMHSAADLVDLVSRFTTNTFTMSTPALAPLGACVSPLVALINHSCDPNAVVVFPRSGGDSRKDQEPLMQVIALRNIGPDEEILTAYVDTTLPRGRRQRLLEETYHFKCRCSLCLLANNQVDWREAMWCPKKCGGVCPLPTEETSLTRCAKCKAPIRDTDAVLDAVRVGQEALDKAEALQFSNAEKAIQLTTKLIPILVSAGLVPAAHPLLALSRLNASLLIAHLSPSEAEIENIASPGVQASFPNKPEQTSQKDAQESLDEAIRAATRSCTGLSQILVEGHPMRGIALAELGKLLSVDEPNPTHLDPNRADRTATSPPSALALNMTAPAYPPSGPQRLKLAYETLVRARKELMIGFGGGNNEGGEVGQNVRKLVVELDKELSVWKTGVKNVMEDRPRPIKK